MTFNEARFAGAVVAAVLLASLVHAPVAAADPDCLQLEESVGFVDTGGRSVDPDRIDAIAYRQVGADVLVYQRTEADASAWVAALGAAGEQDPQQLDAERWLVAQAPGCKMRPNGTCNGACPGAQKCRRVKKPGKDICKCMLIK